MIKLKEVDTNQAKSQGPVTSDKTDCSITTSLLILASHLADPSLHCRLFQKVDQWMNKDEQLDNDAKKRLEDANQVRFSMQIFLFKPFLY